MKKQIIALVSLAVALFGLLGALILLRRQPPVEEGASALSMLGSYEVFRFEAPIAEVTVVQHGNGANYTVKSIPDSSGGDAPSSTLVGREGLPVDASKTGKLLSSAQTLEATQLLYEQADDFGPFGLADPLATIQITDVNGVGKTFLIGNFAPDKSNYYVRLQGESTIYLVPSYRLSVYLQPEASYMRTAITEGGATSYYAAQKISLGGMVREGLGQVDVTPVTAAEATPMDLHTHMLRAPVARPLHYQYGFEALLTLFSLEAAEVTAIGPDEALLAACGLDPDQPYATASVQCQQYGDFRLLAGKPDGAGFVYMMREGTPLLYKVSVDQAPWLEMQFFDLMYSNVSTLYLDEIAEIIISAGGRDYRFVLDHTNSARLEVDIEGRRANRDSFMKLCETLRKARYEEYTFDPLPEGVSPELQVAYRYLSGGPDKLISFYPGPARKYMVDAGDIDFRFYTTSLYVDKVLSETAAAAMPGE